MQHRLGALAAEVVGADWWLPYADCLVCRLGRIGLRGARLFGEGKVRIARAISIHHQRIARKRCRDAKLLLLPVDVRDAVTRWRFDQPLACEGVTIKSAFPT